MTLTINGMEVCCPECGSESISIRNDSVTCLECGHKDKVPEGMGGGTIIIGGTR